MSKRIIDALNRAEEYYQREGQVEKPESFIEVCR